MSAAGQLNPAAPAHLPAFVTAPGESDWLMAVMFVFLLAVVISFGVLFLRLHHLPEHRAHNKVQWQIVAVLTLLAMLTHNNAIWIVALLLALVDLPDFSTPMNSIAVSLEKLSRKADPKLISRGKIVPQGARRVDPARERQGDVTSRMQALGSNSRPSNANPTDEGPA
jgi:hypothetical protein